MIASLRGTVLERTDESTVLVEVAGVGYLVSVTPRTLAELEPGSPAFLYVHHHIREDAQTLFGFLSRDERNTFQVLINTHGIGPALALAILATHSPSALVDIIATADLGALTLVPGVGKKTAERLVVELRDKLAPVEAAAAEGPAGLDAEVISALLNLGCARPQAEAAVEKARKNGAPEEFEPLFRAALALVMK